MSEIRIGAHVEQDDPLAEAAARQAPLVQFFLGDPQGYKGPEVRYPGGAEKLRADAEAAGVDLYVHAPYIVNVATTNNRIRIPSRKLLQQHVDQQRPFVRGFVRQKPLCFINRRQPANDIKVHPSHKFTVCAQF